MLDWLRCQEPNLLFGMLLVGWLVGCQTSRSCKPVLGNLISIFCSIFKQENLVEKLLVRQRHIGNTFEISASWVNAVLLCCIANLSFVFRSVHLFDWLSNLLAFFFFAPMHMCTLVYVRIHIKNGREPDQQILKRTQLTVEIVLLLISQLRHDKKNFCC